MKFFEADGIFFKALSALTNMIEVNLLWILFSLPIVTIGSSTTAAYYVSMKLVKGEEGKITRQFFDSFKSNFKQSTIVWLIFAVYGVVLASDYYYIIKVAEKKSGLLLISTVFISIIYICLILYVFPMIARYENTLKNIFKNSMIVAVRYFMSTVCMIMVLAILIIMGLSSWQALGFIIIFGMGAFSYIASYFITKTFEKLEEAVGDAQKDKSSVQK